MRERKVTIKAAILILLVGALIGCGASGASKSSTKTSASTGQLSASPSAVTFGNVTLGRSSSQTISVSNFGGQTLTITSVGTDGAGISASSITTPTTLAPNQSSSFVVTFAPSSSGVVNGSVYLATDGAGPSVVIPVTANGTSALHQVTLSWNQSSSPVLGYYPYRSTARGGPYTKVSDAIVSSTSYTDDTVVAGASYFYVVTAVGANYQESAFSSEVGAVVPKP